VAVAAFKVLEHGGDGERQQEQPDEDRDMRRLLERSQEILATGVHHVEIPVDGGHRQEGDAGAAVQKQHEEHRFANRVIVASPLPMNVVVGLEGQTEDQQDVGQHQVEQEDVVGVGFPELQLEDEEVEDRHVQRQRQDENHNHDGCVEVVQGLVGGFAVFDILVTGVVFHLSSGIGERSNMKYKLQRVSP